MTPDTTSIADLSAFMDIPAAKTIKTVAYIASGRLILAMVRGDLEINEVKLTNTITRNGINPVDLHLATPEEPLLASRPRR